MLWYLQLKTHASGQTSPVWTHCWCANCKIFNRAGKAQQRTCKAQQPREGRDRRQRWAWQRPVKVQGLPIEVRLCAALRGQPASAGRRKALGTADRRVVHSQLNSTQHEPGSSWQCLMKAFTVVHTSRPRTLAAAGQLPLGTPRNVRSTCKRNHHRYISKHMRPYSWAKGRQALLN